LSQAQHSHWQGGAGLISLAGFLIDASRLRLHIQPL
jgi:hypothetical protein